MAEDTLTFEVGKENSPVTVKGWDGLFAWLEKERAQWGWLQRSGETDLASQLASSVQNQWDQTITAVRQFQNQGHALSYSHNALSAFGPNGQLLVSTSVDGIQVLDIRSSAGDVAGAFAYALLKGTLQWQTVTRQDALLGVLLTVLPDMRDAATVAANLKQERKRFQDSLRSGMVRLEEEFRQRETKFDALVERGTSLALDTLRVRKAEWKEAQERWSDTATTAVGEINAVKEAYLQYMQLRAPVEYWTAKSTAHGIAANKAQRNLAIYFGVFTALLAVAFYCAGGFLLNHQPQAGAGSSTAIYFLVSAGLAVLSTIGFWIGRLLTKLYLSEHHLRTDADERAVMTQTYLALTKESSASEAERQIILTALFRSSSDGIVKDDGPPDIGIQAMVSKTLAR